MFKNISLSDSESSRLYIDNKEVYKIYAGDNLVYDVMNGQDFNYTYDPDNKKFIFYDWKQTINGQPNTTHLKVPRDNGITFDVGILHTHRNQLTDIHIPQKVNLTNSSLKNAFKECNQLRSITINSRQVTSMENAFRNCKNLTSEPFCGDNTTIMYSSYLHCFNIKGFPVSGPNVTDMTSTYLNCVNLTGSPVCG